MRKFIIRFLQFGAMIFFLAVLLEAALYFQENEYSYKRKYIEQNKDAIKILVLGHSHAQNGINPDLLGDSVFNMAIQGRLHYYDAAIAKRYLHTMPNLEAVIWPIGYNFEYDSYKYPLGKSNRALQLQHTYQCMYEKYMGISYEPYIPYMHSSEILFSCLEYGQRFFKSEDEKRGCLKNGFVNLGNHLAKGEGWQNNNLPPKVDYNNPNAAKALQECIVSFKQIAESCKKAHVRLIVVGFPYYQTAREQVTERGLMDKKQCLDSMKAVFPDMEYYEFMNDSRFVPDDFLDATHLNPQGADKLTRILNDTIHVTQ